MADSGELFVGRLRQFEAGGGDILLYVGDG
jgi:hypothetical protein